MNEKVKTSPQDDVTSIIHGEVLSSLKYCAVHVAQLVLHTAVGYLGHVEIEHGSNKQLTQAIFETTKKKKNQVRQITAIHMQVVILVTMPHWNYLIAIHTDIHFVVKFRIYF